MLRTASCVIGAAVFAAACSSAAKTSAPTPAASTSSSNQAASCHTVAGPSGAGGSGDVLVPGDIPDNQAYVTYQSTGGYRLDVPEGWARTQLPATVAFTDKFNSIRVDVTAAAEPTVALAQSSTVPALSRSTPCFQPGAVTQVSRKAGTAILITFKAESAADPVTGKVVVQDVERYEFWRAGKLAVITLASPKGSDNVDPWRKVTDSFAWTA
jgi:hypothetical protein